MERSLPPPTAGWRGDAAAERGTWRRLSDAWSMTLGAEAGDLAIDHAGGALRLHGQSGSGLRLEIKLDDDTIDALARSTTVAINLGDDVDPDAIQAIERIGLIRRGGRRGPMKGAPLWRRGDGARIARGVAALKLRSRELPQVAAFLADRGSDPELQLLLGIGIDAGNLDLTFRAVCFSDEDLVLGGGNAVGDRRGGVLEVASDLPDGDFAQLLNRLLGRYATRLAQQRRAWTDADEQDGALDTVETGLARALVALGRGALGRDRIERAGQLIAAAAELAPDAEEVLLAQGHAAGRSGDVVGALAAFRAAATRRASARNRLELARALRRVANQASDAAIAREQRTEAIELIHGLPADDRDDGPTMLLAEILYEAGRYEDAREALERLSESQRNSVPALGLALRAHVALNDMAAALENARAILAIDPANSLAAFQLRALRHFDGHTSATSVSPVLHLDAHLSATEVAQRLRGQPATWVQLAQSGGADEVLAAPTSAAGFVVAENGAGKPTKLWRLDSLLNLLDAGLPGPDLAELARYEPLFGASDGGVAANRRGNVVVLLSRHGSFKFGGGEHFLASMAEHYRDAGFVPLIVGTRPDMTGQRGITEAGIRFRFSSDTPADLLRLLVEEEATLVHALSGSGFLAAAATAHSRIRLIYGIHYWRELLGDETDRNFFREDGRPNFRPAFDYIVEHASTIYCNSDYTRDLLERGFGVRAPTLYSVPTDRA